MRFFIYKTNRIERVIGLLNRVVSAALFFGALLVFVAIIYNIGFQNPGDETRSVKAIYDGVLKLFLVGIALKAVINRIIGAEQMKPAAIVINSLLYLKLIVMWFKEPAEGEVGRWLFDVLSNDYFTITILVCAAAIIISNTIVAALGKNINPSRVIVVSFASIVVIGTGLLIMPNSTNSPISIIDSFFVSTSAVCVTGLTPIDISTTFTPLGQFFIILLIQIGGVGVMTLTSFFVFFFMGNTSIYSQLTVRDMVSSTASGTLLGMLRRILLITLIIEAVGMLLIWYAVRGTLGMDTHQELAFSAFHSISAFCNAGFSTLPSNLNNPLLTGNYNIFLSVSALIVFGGLGFPIISNFVSSCKYYTRRLIYGSRTKRIPHIFNINTKIVIYATTAILIVSTVLIAIFEWDNAFAGMSAWDKVVQSVFNAVSPRTAGFNSLPMTSFTIQTTLLTMFLMWIGGGSQSTAGGIKVNAFSVIIMNIHAILSRKNKVEVLGRELTPESVSRANATALISIFVIVMAVFTLSYTESHLPLLNVFYEVVSALGTVGLSLDTTPLLTPTGKTIIIALMFVGRVGVITFVLGVLKQKMQPKFDLPKDDVIIN